MPEYTYLLDTRLTPAQQNALNHVRDAARESGMTVFLSGGAVRDLTTGSSVRDLDFSVQGNALDLEAALQARGATLWGRHEPSRTLFFWFPGSVRIEIASTHSESFPKPGQPVYTPSSIVDDLHRRDFTANAMALSLNEGSYGLLLDPLNGVADIEARQLRLVSNYGFIEDPARLVRAVRLRERLGWQLEARTATRYENAKEADNFDVLSPFQRGYEIEKIAAEDDALPVMEALEAEGLLGKLFGGWKPDSVDRAALASLHASRIDLLMQGIAPDLTAAHLEVLTAKMPAADRDRLKAALARPGLRAQWEGLDAAAREFGKRLTGKEAAQPSATWKLFHTAPAEPILWLAHGKKTPAVDAKFKLLFTIWPEVAKQVPVALMLEMRITPELPNYAELLHALFLKQIDGELDTDEAMRAFLDPYSPPAPPPPVTLRRPRGKKAEAKGKRKEIDADDEDDDDEDDDAPVRRGGGDDEDDDDEEEEIDDIAAVPELGLPKKLDFNAVDLDTVLGRIASDDDAEDEEPAGKSEDEPEPEIAPARAAGVKSSASAVKPSAAEPRPAKAVEPAKPVAVKAKPALAEPEKAPSPSPAKAAPAKPEAAPAKSVPVVAPAKTAPAKTAAKATAPGAEKRSTSVPAKKAAAPPPPVKKAAAPPAKKAAKPAPPAPAKKAAAPPVAPVKSAAKAPAKSAKKH